MISRFIFFAAALFACWSGVSFAEPPRIAEVKGLPAGDTLAIRSAPRASAGKIGSLPEGAGPIEVLETVRNGQTEWARIGLSEGTAWTARRYLSDLELPTIGRTALTVGLVCGGTEPFWSLDLESATSAVWRDPADGAEQSISIEQSLGAEARGGWPAALLLSGATFSGVLTASPTECSDGMSDRAYPWTATLLDQTPGRSRLFEGCCGLKIVSPTR